MDSKIRIAVCISGMPRNFEECYRNTLDFFNVDGCEVDFFIHSWTSSWYPPRAKSANKSPEKSINFCPEELKKSLISCYSPKAIVLEDQLSNIELQRTIDHIKNTLLRKTSKQTIPSWVVETLEEGDPDRFLSSPFHLAQTYSISKTADILSEYCVNNDTSYDLVFRFRFDNFMELKTDEYRSKIFKDMDTLIKRDHARSQRATRFKREYLFTAWTSVFGEGGFSRNAVWIGDKIFACSGRAFSRFSNYFRSQVLRILLYNPSKKNTNHELPYFMPENLLSEFCMENDFFSNSMGHLNTFSLVTYRDYHKKYKDQSFNSLQYQYNIRERMNHDSTEGIFIHYDC